MFANLNRLYDKMTAAFMSSSAGVYWLQLAPRERKLVIFLGVFLLLVLMYQMVWQPVADKNRLAQQQLASAKAQWLWLNQQLPAWGKSLYAQSKALSGQATSQKLDLNDNNQLMAFLNQKLTTYKLQSQLKSMQLSSKGVKVSLNSVSAVKLFKWLQLVSEAGILIETMKIEPVEAGRVEATLVFSIE